MKTNISMLQTNSSYWITEENSRSETKEQHALLSKITLREKQVLHLIAYEKTTVDIAGILFISPHTAMSHRKKLLEKFNVKNTAGLVRRAFELGLMSIHSTQQVVEVC